MWDVFSLPVPRNKYKKWNILLHQSIFPLDHMELHVKSLQKSSEVDQCVVQNLTCSGVYLRINLSNNLLQKVLALVPLTATVNGVFVATMTKFFSDYYYTLEDTLTHMKSLELKSYPGENFSDFCAAILVTAEILKSDRAFNPEHRGNITCIFKFNSDSRFCLWEIQKYKEVTYFIKKLRVCDMDAI